MTINDDVFQAILAMDSYNRGGSGLRLNLMEGAETNLGDAAISFNSDSYQLTGAGFFAQAYTWNGKTIISYRGTDFIPTDAITGWPTGLDNER